jgi:hypothetical protein
MGGGGDRTDTIEESGAGEGIQTLDPNLGKVKNCQPTSEIFSHVDP